MAKRKQPASYWVDRPLCKHICRDKDSCKHGACCREHALRAARQPGPDDGGPVSPSTSKPPEGTATPPEGPTGGKDPLSPSGSIGGGEASPPPGPSGGDASGKTPSSGESGGSGKPPREHPPASQQLAEEAGDISSASIETTQEVVVSTPEEEQTGKRDQPNFPAYRIDDQDPDAPAVTADNYRPPLRYLYEYPKYSEVIGDGALFPIVICALPPQAIAQCRRVCKGWRVRIDNAPGPGAATDGTRIDRCRRALFLEADPREVEKESITDVEISSTINAMGDRNRRDFDLARNGDIDAEEFARRSNEFEALQELIPDGPDYSDGSEESEDTSNLEALMVADMPPTVVVNPTLFTLRGRTLLELWPSRNEKDEPCLDPASSQYKCRQMCFRLDPFVALDAGDTRLEMFITQPPVNAFKVSWKRDRYVRSSWNGPATINQDARTIGVWGPVPEDVVVSNKDGVRYRDVINAIEAIYGDRDDSWETDMFRTWIKPVPEVELTNPQTWGLRRIWDGSNDEQNWLYAWNLFRKNDANWEWYCAYHRVMKLGLEASRGVINDSIWDDLNSEIVLGSVDPGALARLRDPLTEDWWIRQVAGRAEARARWQAIFETRQELPEF